jgi:hypothetical protein
MSGTSYLAVSPWFTAEEQPPHLVALNPWEGVSDVYRDLISPPNPRAERVVSCGDLTRPSKSGTHGIGATLGRVVASRLPVRTRTR